MFGSDSHNSTDLREILRREMGKIKVFLFVLSQHTAVVKIVSAIHQTFFHTLFFPPPDLTFILITLRNNLCFRCELSVHTPQQERKKYLTLLYEPLVSVF